MTDSSIRGTIATADRTWHDSRTQTRCGCRSPAVAQRRGLRSRQRPMRVEFVDRVALAVRHVVDPESAIRGERCQVEIKLRERVIVGQFGLCGLQMQALDAVR